MSRRVPVGGMFGGSSEGCAVTDMHTGNISFAMAKLLCEEEDFIRIHRILQRGECVCQREREMHRLNLCGLCVCVCVFVLLCFISTDAGGI